MKFDIELFYLISSKAQRLIIPEILYFIQLTHVFFNFNASNAGTYLPLFSTFLP